MEIEKNEFDDIKSIINEQTRILNEMHNTKAYKLIEGYHFWKENASIHKIPKMGQVFKHVCGAANREIQVQDPMAAVLSMQVEEGKRLDFIELKLKAYQRCMRFLQKIWEARNSVDGVLCVFAPYETMNMPDGYSRRVKNVDNILRKNMLRIYIAKDEGINGMFPEFFEETENHLYVKYNVFEEAQCLLVCLIAHLVGIVYIHSAYQALLPVIRDRSIIKLYDFHGVVPEELSLMGREEERDYYNELEAELVRNSNYIITANQAMKEHISLKYPECEAKFVLMPMNNDDNNLNTKEEEETIFRREKKVGGKPVVIYSGGLQKWQLIPEMQDAICKEKDKCEFHLYVSDPDEFMKIWGNREVPEEWEVSTKTAEELKELYKSAQYGFVLRDDIVVNNVACPTKLIDYIKYDIIPIMKCSRIGDFERYEMKYLSIGDFIKNKFPSEEKRLEMCRENRRIIDKILEEYKVGRDKLKNIIDEQYS